MSNLEDISQSEVPTLHKQTIMLVYQFLSAENAISDISLRRLRISRYAELNDPFELFGATLAAKEHRKMLRAWRKEFNEKNGLLCFSKNWHSPMLWSHYAAKHRGICLVFALADEISNTVSYSPERIEVRFFSGKPAEGLDPSFIKALQVTKYEHWAYEQEVRVFLSIDSSNMENGSIFEPFSDKLILRGVIIGPLCEMPMDRVRQLTHGMYDCVSVIKARLAFKSFNVVGDEKSVREDVAFHQHRGTHPLWVVKEPSGIPKLAVSGTVTNGH
jgi:hypothetical protein